jgi:hypothetical protein
VHELQHASLVLLAPILIIEQLLSVPRQKKFALGPWSQRAVIIKWSSKSKHYFRLRWETEGLNGEPSGSKSKRWYAAQQLKMVKKGEQAQGDGGETSAGSSSPSDDNQVLSESDDSSGSPRNKETQFVGRPVSVVSTWFGSQWSRDRHGLDWNVIWYTGKSLSWDPDKKRYLVGFLEGDAEGISYEMNLQCEIEGNSVWEKHGQPNVGGVTSSAFPPRSLAPASPDVDGEDSGMDNPSTSPSQT